MTDRHSLNINILLLYVSYEVGNPNKKTLMKQKKVSSLVFKFKEHNIYVYLSQNAILLHKVVSFFCRQLKISVTTEPIEFPLTLDGFHHHRHLSLLSRA